MRYALAFVLLVWLGIPTFVILVGLGHLILTWI